MKNSNNALKLVGAILIGAAIGGTLGILFAPDKGSNTRKKITRKGEDIKDSIKDKFNEFVDSISEKFESVKEDISDAAEKVKSKSEKE